MRFPNGHVDYAVKLDGADLIGVAKVTLPTVKYKTVPVTGAGVGGDVEVPLAAMIDAMSAKFDFSSITDAIMALGDNKWHNVALYDAFQYFNSETGEEELEADRIEMAIRPTETNLGTVATASAADASGTYSVRKFTVYKDGEKVMDINQLALKHLVNGVDCAEALRKALGMM